jgi:hypothetical protein
MGLPESKNDREYRSYRVDADDSELTRQATITTIDPNQLPLPVLISEGSSLTLLSLFNTADQLPQNVETTLIQYVVPASRKAFVQFVDISGENLGLYKVKLNGQTIARRRTWWATGLDAQIIFAMPGSNGLELFESDTLTVTVENVRIGLADFEARALVLQGET